MSCLMSIVWQGGVGDVVVVVEFVDVSVVVGEVVVVVEFVDVFVVVGEVVVVVEVVDSSQSTYSGQLQTFILESK